MYTYIKWALNNLRGLRNYYVTNKQYHFNAAIATVRASLSLTDYFNVQQPATIHQCNVEKSLKGWSVIRFMEMRRKKCNHSAKIN